MTKDRQRLAEYLAHMLQAFERIGQYRVELDEFALLQNDPYLSKGH